MEQRCLARTEPPHLPTEQEAQHATPTVAPGLPAAPPPTAAPGLAGYKKDQGSSPSGLTELTIPLSHSAS